LAEGVSAVIEVKSNLSAQWREVEASARALKALKRSLEGAVVQLGYLPEDVPLFAVGYTGWQSIDALRDHVRAIDADGALVIDPGLYVSSERLSDPLELTGPQALWGLITSIHEAMTCIRVMDVDPGEYVGRVRTNDEREQDQ
jgi:hypothetical protein